ncbi:hypothetical protein KBT16_21375, partial [Nostoc sp. CCCryo 231-06]|nr:hypothetical protein [Nostoc sp. CCCryo 231-06]
LLRERKQLNFGENWGMGNEFCPMPYALCPMPYALCPMPYALCPNDSALIPGFSNRFFRLPT